MTFLVVAPLAASHMRPPPNKAADRHCSSVASPRSIRVSIIRLHDFARGFFITA